MRPALPVVLLLASAACAQLPGDGHTAYSRDDRIKIPFDINPKDKVSKVVLYYAYEGGNWQEADSVRPGGRREFIFRADREGSYAFATMTHMTDGKTDPDRKDQLREQKRVVFDKSPPKVVVRASLGADGAPGIEWDVADEYMDQKGVRLEFRWPEMGRFEAIDKNVPFGPRDSRHWQLKASDRMQVRVVATDRAGNKTESDPVWVSAKDAAGGGDAPLPKTVAGGASPVKDPDVSPARTTTSAAQPALHYVNTRTLSLKVNATVGPSGLKKAYLYVADDKLTWTKARTELGPLPAPPSTDPDKRPPLLLDFTYQAERDGLHNFIVIVENHRGKSRHIPQKGDPGDVQVMVDTTPPAIELVGVPRVSSNGDRGAFVDIKWKATDANIAPVPIKLEYQAVRDEKPGEGEWKAITPDWIDNTGQHTWSAPTGEAYLFHIRVTCRDRAGNENVATTAVPVNVDTALPGVQGVDVAPGKGLPGGAGMAVPGVPGVDPIQVGAPVVTPKSTRPPGNP